MFVERERREMVSCQGGEVARIMRLAALSLSG